MPNSCTPYIPDKLISMPNSPSIVSASTRSFFLTQNSCKQDSLLIIHLPIQQADISCIELKTGLEKRELPTRPTLLIERKTVPATTSASPKRGLEPPESQIMYWIVPLIHISEIWDSIKFQKIGQKNITSDACL